MDDGFSGGNFQRPAFQQMIADMENGEVGIIVTKDLSRLGRNQLHTGLYIEERFPMFGVRYIAINDNVDTENAESNDLMPFKNLFNEWFIWDTSRKIRAVQKAKAERGERLGTRAPYGYVKDLETKKLVIDEEAAAVVKRNLRPVCRGQWPQPDCDDPDQRKGVLSQLLHLPEIRPDAFRLGHHEAVPLVGQRSREPVRK